MQHADDLLDELDRGLGQMQPGVERVDELRAHFLARGRRQVGERLEQGLQAQELMSATQSHSATARRSPNDAPTCSFSDVQTPIAPFPRSDLSRSSSRSIAQARRLKWHARDELAKASCAPRAAPRSPCAAARKRRVKSPARSRPPAADPRRRTISLGRAPTQRGRRDRRAGARSVRWHAPSHWAVTRIDDQRSSAGARARRPRPLRSLRRRRRCYTSRRAYPRRVTSRPSGWRPTPPGSPRSWTRTR